MKKATTGQAAIDNTRRTRARENLIDMKGDGGGFTNLFLVGATNLFSLFGTFFEPTPYRNWGDTDSMNSVGRATNGALALFGGHHAVKGFREGFALRRAHGMNAVRQVWWQQGKLWKPLPHSAFKNAAAAEDVTYKVTTADRIINGAGSVVKWPFKQIWRPFAFAGSKIKAGLPTLTAGQEASLAGAAAKTGTFMDKLVHGVIVLGIVQYADEKITGPISVFEMGFAEEGERTLNANPIPRLQDFDPVRYPQGTPKIIPTRLGE